MALIPVGPLYTVDGKWSAGGDGGATDAQGVVWQVNSNGTSGIFDTSGNHLNHTPFNEYDGSQRSKNFSDPLPITIAGSAQGPNADAIVKARDTFCGLLEDGNTHDLVVRDINGRTLTIRVEKNGSQKVSPVGYHLDFDYQFNAIAADPRKLVSGSTPQIIGLPNSSGGLDWATGGGLFWGASDGNGLLTVTNTGSKDVWPKWTINGPTDASNIQNPSITDQGSLRQLLFSDILFAGDVVVINTSPYDRFTTKNGTPYRRLLTTAQYFPIKAGTTVTVQFGGIATGSPSTAQLTCEAAVAAIA